jgi:hypothetical protein
MNQSALAQVYPACPECALALTRTGPEACRKLVSSEYRRLFIAVDRYACHEFGCSTMGTATATVAVEEPRHGRYCQAALL